MIIVREWDSKKGFTTKDILGNKTWYPTYHYKGWFLFGIIPLYIVRD